MKKITILAAVVALLGSCAQNTEDTINPNTKAEGRTIYATFDNEEEETKTYVENYKYLRWHAGDEISFFDATTHNSQYAFAGNDGDAEGEFNAVATGEGTAIATTYGVYPYNANTAISTEGVITAELPATQAYGVNSFGNGANTMVAVGESATDDKLFFKNACGYLVVKLYNESGATVKSVVLEGNNEEKIAGAATITATHAGVPSVTMTDTATTSVTIDCGEGVEIGTTAETATEFWFALPEITFEGGITITATDTEGKEYEKTTTKPVAITRNNVQPMKALGAFFMPHIIPETWKIYYTASSKVEPYNKTVFGANYVSNEWGGYSGVITFDGEVTSIGERAFYNDDSLKSITIPNSVTSIGQNAFYQCTSLTSVTIPDSVTNIGHKAFSNCTSLQSINIPNSVTSMGISVFSNSTGELTINSPMVELTYSGYGNRPNYYEDEENYYYHWLNYAQFTSLVIGNDVTKIGYGAFWGCPTIEKVTIPSSVTQIGERAFRECPNLSTVYIGGGAIDTQAFESCVKLHTVSLGSVTSIGNYAFEDCISLTSVSIPNSVQTIGYSAFRNCSSLTSVTLGSGMSSISQGLFYGCSNLQVVTIPDNITLISDQAFYNCTGLLNLTLGKNIATIGEQAFYGCGKNVVGGANLYVNCATTFNERGGYKATSRDHWLYGSNFYSITIGDNVTSVGKYAFYGYTPLRWLTIGSEVWTINRGAFWDCANLQDVGCKPTYPPCIYYNASTQEGSFPFNSGMSIRVPANSYDTYTMYSISSGYVATGNWAAYKTYLWKTSFQKNLLGYIGTIGEAHNLPFVD